MGLSQAVPPWLIDKQRREREQKREQKRPVLRIPLYEPEPLREINPSLVEGNIDFQL